MGPPITRLPVELFARIIEYYHDSAGLRSLQSLRLVNKDFAHSGDILKPVFHGITIRPHQDYSDVSLAVLAPFVRKVRIEPVLISTSTRVQRRYDTPISPDQVYAANDHLVAPWRYALESGSVCLSLAAILSRLDRAESFVVNAAENEYWTRQFIFPSGKEVFFMAFKALALARKSSEEMILDFGGEDNVDSKWLYETELWTEIAWGQLRVLRLRRCHGTYLSEDSEEAGMLTFLHRCASSLRELWLDSMWGIKLWDRFLLIHSTVYLRKVVLKDAQIQMPIFAEWIGECLCLQELSISHKTERSGYTEEITDEWATIVT